MTLELSPIRQQPNECHRFLVLIFRAFLSFHIVDFDQAHTLTFASHDWFLLIALMAVEKEA